MPPTAPSSVREPRYPGDDRPGGGREPRKQVQVIVPPRQSPERPVGERQQRGHGQPARQDQRQLDAVPPQLPAPPVDPTDHQQGDGARDEQHRLDRVLSRARGRNPRAPSARSRWPWTRGRSTPSGTAGRHEATGRRTGRSLRRGARRRPDNRRTSRAPGPGAGRPTCSWACRRCRVSSARGPAS